MEKIYDIIIVGAGPAGLTAGLYAVRANRTVLMFEKLVVGGQVVNSSEIANYPGVHTTSGAEIISTMQSQVEAFGAEIKYENVVDIKKVDNVFQVIANDTIYKAKSVILATGNKSRKLNLPNEEKFLGRGVSYCAVCDGGFFRNKEVAVVGGGDSALEYTKYMSNIASKVYLVNKNLEFKGDRTVHDFVKRLEKEGKIEVLAGYTTTQLQGENNLERLVVVNNSTNESIELKVSGVFVAIGKDSANTLFLNEINQDEKGYIITDENMKTSIDGVFACGDVRKKSLKQIVTACSDGAIAATNCIKYIDKK